MHVLFVVALALHLAHLVILFSNLVVLRRRRIPEQVTTLPWHLVRRLPFPALATINGQCWMIDASMYREHRPHAHVRNEILEDVAIARFLRRHGIVPVLTDLRDAVDVRTYGGLSDAWRGFRKNAYPIFGGRPAVFVPLWIRFTLAFVVASLFPPVLFVTLYAIRLGVDRFMGFPFIQTLAAPLSYLPTSLFQIDSFAHHVTGRLTRKGRRVQG